MYIYNTTFGIDPAIEREFLFWLKNEFLPSADSEKSGGSYSFSPEILRVINNDKEVISLAVHFRADSMSDIEDWYSDHGSELFSFVNEHWYQKAVFFSTTLEVI